MSSLRTVSDALYHRLLGAFPADRSYLPSDLAQPPMPAPVGHFLKTALDQRIAQEIAPLDTAHSVWFDYEHPDVQEARQAFADALTTHARIPAESWAALLRQAVQLVTAHLVRPVRVLVNFVYEDERDVLPLHIVRRRLAHFTVYPYFQEVVSGYVAQRDLQEIDRPRLQSLLERTDRHIVEDYGPDDWIRLLQPLYRLLRVLDQEGVPTPLLRVFFRGKGRMDIEQRLAEQQEGGGREILRPDDLRLLLAPPPPKASPTRPAEPQRPPERRREAPRPAEGRQRPLPPPAESKPAFDEPAYVPLWKQFQQERPPVPEASKREVTKPDTRAARPPQAPDEPPEELPLWQRYRPQPDLDDAPPALPDLERNLFGPRGERNRALFVKHLFSGSEPEYEQVLQRIYRSRTWLEASQVIAQEVFRKHQVNIYSEPAVTFTDAIESRFRAG